MALHVRIKDSSNDMSVAPHAGY